MKNMLSRFPFLNVLAMVSGVTLVTLAAAGERCNSSHQAQAQPVQQGQHKQQPIPKPKPTEIIGEVRVLGATAPIRKLDRSDEPACENGTAYVETVVVSDGRLANVHVGIASGTMGTFKPPRKPVIVHQVDCLYVPRIQGLMAGQKVLVINGDPTMHNVHARQLGNSVINKSQPVSAKPLELDSGPAGSVLKLGCDVHRWMRAFLPVTDHPFFDVTGRDGTFKITGVPRGKTVLLRAWHEKFGEQEKQVKAGERVIFTFRP